MRNSNKKDDFNSSNVDTKLVVIIIVVIAVIVFGLYFINFHHGLSEDNGKWGTFGDYVGGILNPIIAGFAFYLIAKTYDLQRELLKVSTDAQEKQIKLAALTALLNSNLTRISLFEAEKIPLLQGTLPKPKEHENTAPEIVNQMRCERSPQARQNEIESRIIKIDSEINELKESNTKLEEQIKGFLNAY